MHVEYLKGVIDKLKTSWTRILPWSYPTVTVRWDQKLDRGYTPEGIRLRRRHDRLEGRVVDYSDSHGLCFKVMFWGGQTAWYEPEEIGVTT